MDEKRKPARRRVPWMFWATLLQCLQALPTRAAQRVGTCSGRRPTRRLAGGSSRRLRTAPRRHRRPSFQLRECPTITPTHPQPAKAGFALDRRDFSRQV